MKTLEVLEKSTVFSFSYEELLKYHGVGYPGGVAHAFQVMRRAFPLRDGGKLLERREISLVTAFPGPGGLDAFEMVTRCVTDGRILVDKELPEAANEMESPHGRYYFRFAYRGRSVVVTIRPGFVKAEFVQLARKENLTQEEADLLIRMKKEMASRLLSAEAAEIYRAEVL